MQNWDEMAVSYSMYASNDHPTWW